MVQVNQLAQLILDHLLLLSHHFVLQVLLGLQVQGDQAVQLLLDCQVLLLDQWVHCGPTDHGYQVLLPLLGDQLGQAHLFLQQVHSIQEVL